MSSAQPREPASPLQRNYQFFPALLSYLVPGLGQIAQGRVAKGVLFFVCILTLFYYGMYLGKWSNVYLPDTSEEKNLLMLRGKGAIALAVDRIHFVAQFWVGIAAWPAIIQWATYDRDAEEGPLFGTYQRLPYESRSMVRPDNPDDPESRRLKRKGLKPEEALADWQGKTLNELQNEGDKSWDLGWVMTVIAGALNILVIYDALAGPAYVIVPDEKAEA